MRVAVISDTHGLLRPAVADALRGAPLILHAGDVGKDAVLDALEGIAPTIAVRGNVDRTGRVGELPETRTVDVAGRRVHLVHDRNDVAVDPTERNIDVVLSGHSHKHREEVSDGVLWLNPGSVGPRRFKLPISMAWLTFGPGHELPRTELVTFEA